MNYTASSEAVLEATCPLGQDKCSYYDSDTKLCIATGDECLEADDNKDE